MLNCQWAMRLTQYDCRPVRTKHGENGLEIGTPFSLPGGAALNLYLVPEGGMVRITDNADTLFQLSGVGLDVWTPQRRKSIRDAASKWGLAMGDQGDLFALARPEQAQWHFARALSGLLAVGAWAAEQMHAAPEHHDLAAEAEPYLRAWRANLPLTRRIKVRGASRNEYVFDFQQGSDIIDVISAYATSTGAAMRKVGDVTNGPFAEGLKPLIIIDDRQNPNQAGQEQQILGSIARVMMFTRLQSPRSLLH